MQTLATVAVINPYAKPVRYLARVVSVDNVHEWHSTTPLDRSSAAALARLAQATHCFSGWHHRTWEFATDADGNRYPIGSTEETVD